MEPYSQQEAEAAVGLYTDNGPRKESAGTGAAVAEEMEVEEAA